MNHTCLPVCRRGASAFPSASAAPVGLVQTALYNYSWDRLTTFSLLGCHDPTQIRPRPRPRPSTHAHAPHPALLLGVTPTSIARLPCAFAHAPVGSGHTHSTVHIITRTQSARSKCSPLREAHCECTAPQHCRVCIHVGMRGIVPIGAMCPARQRPFQGIVNQRGEPLNAFMVRTDIGGYSRTTCVAPLLDLVFTGAPYFVWAKYIGLVSL